MKSTENVQLGDRFEAKVSRRVVVVCVEAIEIRTTTGKRQGVTFLCRNMETLRRVSFKSKRRFLRRVESTNEETK